MRSEKSEKKFESDEKFKKMETLDRLDRTFDLLLVLLSIISAALFQYACTIEPLNIAAVNQNLTQPEFFNEVDMTVKKELGIFFVPLVILIILWFINKLFLRTKIRTRKLFSEFCYLMAFSIVTFNTALLFGVTFQLFPMYLTQLGIIFYVLSFLASLSIVYAYESDFISKKISKVE